MNNIWVKNKEDNDMTCLKNCISCYTYVYEKDDEEDVINRYRIYFIYEKKQLNIDFKSEVEMQNFYDHLQDILKPIVIDPKQKPLKL